MHLAIINSLALQSSALIDLGGRSEAGGALAEVESTYRAAGEAENLARDYSARGHQSLERALKRGAEYFFEDEKRYRSALGMNTQSSMEVESSYQAAVAAENLARDRDARGYQSRGVKYLLEAESHYRVALAMNPQSSTTWTGLAQLLYDRRDLQEAASSYEMALELAPRLHFDQWRLGGINWLLGNSDLANANWKDAIAKLQQAGLSPVHVAMNLVGIGGEAGYRREVMKEMQLFEALCSNAGRELGMAGLPAALREVRSLENSTDWLIQWAKETIDSNDTSLLYGTTWFSAWRRVVAMLTSSVSFVPHGTALVIGSGLGDQCHFALVLGFEHCLGYEILCKSLVAPARRIAEENGLSGMVRFRCADAQEAAELGSTSFAWVNDLVFPEDVRRRLHLLLATKLQEGAFAVFYRKPLAQLASLVFVSTVAVSVSWEPSVNVHIFKKVSIPLTRTTGEL